MVAKGSSPGNAAVEFQQKYWDTLEKSISRLVTDVNVTNLEETVLELCRVNLMRGRGIFCQACMRLLKGDCESLNLVAALVAGVNSKIPDVGYLFVRRVLLVFKNGFKENDRDQMISSANLIVPLLKLDLVRQSTVLYMLIWLLSDYTDESVEVATLFIKKCGYELQQYSEGEMGYVFDRLKEILCENDLDERVRAMVEGVFADKETLFRNCMYLPEALDIVDVDDQVTHEFNIHDEIDPENDLDVFELDPFFEFSEKRYQVLKKEILGEDCSEDEGEYLAEYENNLKIQMAMIGQR